MMALALVELQGHPGRIAATRVGGVVEGGTFFVDFSRPLDQGAGLESLPKRCSPRVIHENSARVATVIGAHRSEPRSEQLRALWKQRYPSPSRASVQKAEGLQIIADFACQFRQDAS